MSKIQRWGNSQGLRLSKELLKTADIAVGDEVKICADKGKIVIEKSRRYDLAKLIAQLPEDYQVIEEDLGEPVGQEAW
jgi:antitoxin MazE